MNKLRLLVRLLKLLNNLREIKVETLFHFDPVIIYIFFKDTLDILRIQVAAKEAQREAAKRVIEQEAELMSHERELRRRVSYFYSEIVS